MTTRVEKSFFTTESLPSGQRLPVWRESISTIFDITPPQCQAAHHFNARLSSYLINDQVMLSRCQTTAQRFERNALRTARDGLDYYLLQTHLAGFQQITRAGRQRNSHVGDLMIIDLASQHRAEASNFTNLSLVVPRHLLAPLLTRPDSQAGRIIRGDAPLAALAIAHLKMLEHLMTSMTSDQAEQIISPTLMLMACALNGDADSVDGGQGSIQAHLKTRARLLIEKNLAGNITLEALCKALCISRASLYRLFSPDGGVHAYIRERRLKRCAEALLSPANARRRIYDIAFSWGFHSEAHFSRAFRARFGMSPSEARESSRQLPVTPGLAEFADIGDRDYEQWLSQRLR